MHQSKFVMHLFGVWWILHLLWENKSNVQYPSWTKQWYNSNFFNSNQTFNPLWIQYFVGMCIAIVISLFFNIFLLYLRKIYLHLHIWCMMRIALCTSFSICKGLYAKEAETFHRCTTTQARANIFVRYSMDVKAKEGDWKNVNYHGSISSFKVYLKYGGRCKKPMSDVTDAKTKVVVSWFGQRKFHCSSNFYCLASK